MSRLAVPERMSFADCARNAQRATARGERRLREQPSAAAVPARGRRDTFKAAEVNRLVADWVTTLLHPDDELRWSLRRMRSRSRDLCRNNPYARHFLNMLAVNVIGPYGIQHQAQVRDNDGKLNKVINAKIEAAWADWCQEVTVDGKLSMSSFQRQSIKGVPRDGESLVRIWRGFEGNRYGIALEAVDPDQLDEQYNRGATDRDAEIRLGVEVNDFGRPLAYHLWNKTDRLLGNSFDQRKRVPIPADQVIHLYDIERANQTRGLIWFLAVAVTLKMLDGYSEAELIAARTGAAKQGWFVRKGDVPISGEAAPPDADNRMALDAAPGTIDYAPEGYEFAEWSPEHPSTAFADFMKSKLREVATGVSVSYNALASDLEGVTFSSMRSGLSLEREMWRMLQQWWISSFLRRIYPEWLNSALLTGALVLDSRNFQKFTAAKWTPRGWPYIDPEKETKSGIDGIQTGLDCRTDILAEQGKDFEYILARLKEEQELAAEMGVDISGPKPTASSLFGGGGGGAGNAGTKEEESDGMTRRLSVVEKALVSRNGSNGKH